MKVKIAVIGCGGIAGAHIIRLAKIEGIEFTAFCDVEREKAESKSTEYGGKSYSDFREMFSKEKLDACFICVPPFAHEGQEEMCIANGIPFFIEKPVHLELEKAKKIAGEITKKGIITAAGYVLRNYDVVEKARELLKDVQIGLVSGRYFSRVPGQEGSWLHKKELSGGQLIEQATHTVDLMRYLAGDVEEVFTYSFAGINKELYEGYDAEDASVTSLKFKSGAAGELACTWLRRGFVSRVEVIGSDLFVSCEGKTLTVQRGDETETFVSETDAMLEEDRDFIKAVKGGSPSLIKSDYVDAVKTLETTLKCNISMESGKPVKI